MLINKNNKDIQLKDELKSYTRISKNKDKNMDICINRPSYYNLNLEVMYILPGLVVIRDYSEFIRRYCTKEHIFKYKYPENLLIINNIIEGHGQIAVGEDKFIPFKENDILIHFAPSKKNYIAMYGTFKAIHIIIDKKMVKDNEYMYKSGFKKIIKELFLTCIDEKTILLQNKCEITDLFEQMKEFQPEDYCMKRFHTQIKIGELLLHIYMKNLALKTFDYRTYTDAQIRVVRKIKNHLSRDIASYISLEVLSVSYGINLTTLKNCFRDMYGKPLYTWYREYKFHRAKELIKNTDLPISKIAHMIGYRSSSKFTKAFKKEMGVLPSSYRKK